MTKDPEVLAAAYEPDLVLPQLVQCRKMIRESKAKVAADKRLVLACWRAVEESKQRLAIKPKKR